MLLLETNKQVSNTIYNCNCVVNKDFYFEVRESGRPGELTHEIWWFWKGTNECKSVKTLEDLVKESNQLCSIYDMRTEVLQICTLI